MGRFWIRGVVTASWPMDIQASARENAADRREQIVLGMGFTHVGVGAVFQRHVAEHRGRVRRTNQEPDRQLPVPDVADDVETMFAPQRKIRHHHVRLLCFDLADRLRHVRRLAADSQIVLCCDDRHEFCAQACMIVHDQDPERGLVEIVCFVHAFADVDSSDHTYARWPPSAMGPRAVTAVRLGLSVCRSMLRPQPGMSLIFSQTGYPHCQ